MATRTEGGKEWQVVAYDNGADKPISWRVWCSQPVRYGRTGIGYHLSTAHYRTREAALHQVAKYRALVTTEAA